MIDYVDMELVYVDMQVIYGSMRFVIHIVFLPYLEIYFHFIFGL